MGRHRDPSLPREPDIQIDVTLTLPRQIAWLLAGVAAGHLHAFNQMIEKVGHILQAVTG